MPKELGARNCMEDDRYNDLAALLESSLEGPQRERVLAEIHENPPAREVLYAASFPGLRETLQARVPFDTVASFVVGVSGPFFRVLDLDGFSLVRGSARLAGALANISGGTLPTCSLGRIEAEVRLGSSSAGFGFLLQESGDTHQLLVQPNGITSGRVEIWRNGHLVRSLPIENLGRRPLEGLDAGSSVSLRSEGAETGATLILAPVELGRKDRMAACLASALAGSLGEALRVLMQPDPAGHARDDMLARVASWLQAAFAVTKSVNSVLCPLPALRSASVRPDDRQSLFLPVWNGIRECWPEATCLPNPWSRQEDPSPPGPMALPEAVLCLAQATIESASGSVPVVPTSTYAPADSRIMEGWAAVDGLRFLANQDYASAAERLASVPAPSHGDPFGLITGAALARHLMISEAADPAEKECSSDQVWRRIFEGVL